MFVRDGAVTPGPSRKCDITFFVKGRPKSARQSRDSTVAARSVQSVTVPSSRVSRECRSPGLRSPPFKNARDSRCESPGHLSSKKGFPHIVWEWPQYGWRTQMDQNGPVEAKVDHFGPTCGREYHGSAQNRARKKSTKTTVVSKIITPEKLCFPN